MKINHQSRKILIMMGLLLEKNPRVRRNEIEKASNSRGRPLLFENKKKPIKEGLNPNLTKKGIEELKLIGFIEEDERGFYFPEHFKEELMEYSKLWCSVPELKINEDKIEISNPLKTVGDISKMKKCNLKLENGYLYDIFKEGIKKKEGFGKFVPPFC